MHKIISVSFIEKGSFAGNVYVSTDDDPKFYHNEIGNNVNVQLISFKNKSWLVKNLETGKQCNVSIDTLNKFFHEVSSLCVVRGNISGRNNMMGNPVGNSLLRFSMAFLGFSLLNQGVKSIEEVRKTVGKYKLFQMAITVINYFLLPISFGMSRYLSYLDKNKSIKPEWIEIKTNQAINARQWMNGELNDFLNEPNQLGDNNGFLTFFSDGNELNINPDLIQSCIKSNDYVFVDSEQLDKVSSQLKEVKKVLKKENLFCFKVSQPDEIPDSYVSFQLSDDNSDEKSQISSYFFDLKKPFKLDEFVK